MNQVFGRFTSTKQPCGRCEGLGRLPDNGEVCPRCTGTGYVYNKFNAAKTEYNGRKYDSKREAAKAEELDMFKMAGQIVSWEPQVDFTVFPKWRDKRTGKIHRAIKYRADFFVKWADGTEEVIDIKGFVTPVFKIKWKMLEYKLRDRDIKLTVEK